MDLHQAIDEVMKGNEVSRVTLGNSGIKRIMYLSGQVIKFKYSDDSIVDNDVNTICRVDARATDWRPHNKLFNLSEKRFITTIVNDTHNLTTRCYTEEDIKEFIFNIRKEVHREYVGDSYLDVDKVLPIIYKLAGKRFK